MRGDRVCGGKNCICSFSVKAKNAEEADAVAVIVLNTDMDSTFINMQSDLVTRVVAVPVLIMATRDARVLLGIKEITESFRVSVEEFPVDAVRAQNSWQHLIDWSSGGPTDDGRIKPDVVAPGDRIVSAHVSPC